jgi:hypothetical protein
LILNEDGVFVRCACNDLIPAEKTTVSIDDQNLIRYSFRAGCKSKLAHYVLNSDRMSLIPASPV